MKPHRIVHAAARVHGVPEPSDLPQREPGEADPPDPRKSTHRPTDAPPIDVPVPKLRPLELC